MFVDHLFCIRIFFRGTPGDLRDPRNRMNAAMRRGRLSRVDRFWSMNFLCQPKDSRRTVRIVRTRISTLVRFARIRTKRTACAQHFAPKKNFAATFDARNSVAASRPCLRDVLHRIVARTRVAAMPRSYAACCNEALALPRIGNCARVEPSFTKKCEPRRTRKHADVVLIDDRSLFSLAVF